MAKRKSFVCSSCGQELPASELSNQCLVQANVSFLAIPRKEKVREALYRLEPKDQVCSTCDWVDGNIPDENPDRDWGRLYEVAFGVPFDIFDMSDGELAALGQSF